MNNTTPRIRSLLRQADRIAQAQKRTAAEKLYRQIIDEAPDTVPAWIGLAEVLADPDEREDAYRQALLIDPDNELAKNGLRALEDGEPIRPGILESEKSPDHLSGDNSVADAAIQTTGSPAENPGAGPIKASQADVKEQTSDYVLQEPVVHARKARETEVVLYCANHPHRATHLRCNRCGKPICSSCAQSTPVGYRCPECIREQEETFFTARPLDYLIALIIALPVSLFGGWLATALGFWSIFLAAIAGTLIGRLVFWAVGRRRGRGLPQMIGVVVVIGGILPGILVILWGAPFLKLLWTGIYVVTASGSAYYQMR